MYDYFCARCHKPLDQDSYEQYGQMHWICYHFEYEHEDYNPDDACEEPNCPWNQITMFQTIIVDNGLNLNAEIDKYFEKLDKEEF